MSLRCFGEGCDTPLAAAAEAERHCQLCLSLAVVIHQRAVALEQRCQRAWHVRVAGGDMTSPLPQWFIDRMKNSDGDKFHGFWEAMVRQELRADPTLLNNS